MNLLLIRHGETALNVARVLQPADTPLGERGIAQAGALAQRLANHGLRGVVSSDLPRAWSTAAAIGRATGLVVEATRLLRERDFGDWRGCRYDALPFDPLMATESPPNGESSADFERRVAAAWELILQRQHLLGGPLAVVTHGLVIRRLLASQVRLADGMSAPTHLSNTGLTIVDAEPPHRVQLLDCTAHLLPNLGDDADALSGG